MKKQSVKSKILQAFLERPDRALSGEQLAAAFQVSRTAVWKAVNTLRAEGYRIEGQPKSGYRLLPDQDAEGPRAGRFNAAEIIARLPEQCRAFYEVHTVEETGSTNSDVRDRGLQGAKEGYVLFAESQTAGRGRQGRRFFSPKGSGLYVSILLRPDLPATEAVLLDAMAGVAAARAVESLLPAEETDASGSASHKSAGEAPQPVMIKWVNDLFFRGRKICGILTEGQLSMENGGFDQAVLGLGFNLTAPEEGWPEEIRVIAGGLFSAADPDRAALPADARADLAAAFLREFLPLYRGLSDKTFLPEYRSRMMILGKEVILNMQDGRERTAEAVDIDDQCRLLVRFPDQEMLTPLGSGEVRIRPKA